MVSRIRRSKYAKRLPKRMRRKVSRMRKSRRGQIKKYTTRGGYGKETKTIDYTFLATQVNPYVPDRAMANAYTIMPIDNNTTNIQALNIVTQGAAVSQRIGNKIAMKSLRLRFSLFPNAVAGAALTSNVPTSVRTMIIYDRQPVAAGTYPATNTILAPISTAGVIGNGTCWDNIDPNQLERYVTLMDKLYVLPPWNMALVVQPAQNVGPCDLSNFQIDEYIKLRNLETLYRLSSGTIGDIVTGALYLVVIGSEGQNNGPYSWKGTIRFRFHDN